MKTNCIKLLLILFIFNLTSCKKEVNAPSFSEFQYADQPEVINCASANNQLLNEAMYSFEKDITAYFDSQQNSVIKGYNGFIRSIPASRKPDLKLYASEHSVRLAKELSKTGVFSVDKLNYNHEVIQCIADNMTTADLKTTFNALLSTNSMRKSLFQPTLAGQANRMNNDKHLGLYVALEYYYAEINKTDFSKVDFEKRETKTVEPVNRIRTTPISNNNNGKVDFNKRPRK